MAVGAKTHSETAIRAEAAEHWRYFARLPFTEQQREHTTILFGGLTSKQERLLRGALTAYGYKSDILPIPTAVDFQTGKEYGNYGQCNPTYFTSGSLLNYLKSLEKKGLTRQEIVDRYVFVTPASPCGPCRFGMYQNEYRLVTENAGFVGFRVIAFAQKPGLTADPEAGFDVNLDLSLALLFAVLIGDIINEAAYAVRPFEVNAGETDRVVDRSLSHMEGVIAGLALPSWKRMNRILRFVIRLFPGTEARLVAFLTLQRWLFGDHLQTLLAGLRQTGRWFDDIEVDRTRVKPIVKITGEFWAQTTEGDGNFRMFQFLEKEGAQLLIDPVTAWFHYLVHVARQQNRDRSHLVHETGRETTRLERVMGSWRRKRKGAILSLVDKVYRRLYDQMRAALNHLPHRLVDQDHLEELAHGFYHSRLKGGEGHLEVAKNIYYQVNHLAHMVLSLKPFGCLPSIQSDAVQASAQRVYGDLTFLPIETSGVGEVIVLSRVHMALGEIKRKAREEFGRALEETGLTVGEVKKYAAAHLEMNRPSYRVPHHPGTVGAAANFVYHVRRLMDEERCRTSGSRSDSTKGDRLQ